MSDTNTPDHPATPDKQPATRGWERIPLAAVLLLSSLYPGSIAYIAVRQPGCPLLLNASLAVACGLMAAMMCWFAVRCSIRSKVARIIAGAILAMLLVAFYAMGLTLLDRMRGGADLVRVSWTLSGITRARLQAIEEGLDDPSTVMVLMHERFITPGLIFDYTCPTLPPMPRVDTFNYAGITADDAVSQRVTREALIEAANQSLRDQPWERIGWFNFLREWPKDAESPRQHHGLIVAYAIYERSGAKHALVTYGDSSTRYWGEPADDDDRAELAFALTVANALGVAPPPQELMDFVNTPPEPRR